MDWKLALICWLCIVGFTNAVTINNRFIHQMALGCLIGTGVGALLLLFI